MEIKEQRIILKPNRYREDRPFSIKEKLYNYELSPVVAYGVDKGTHIEYVEAQNESDLKDKLEKIKKVAYVNNSQIKVEFSIEDIKGESILSIVPHEYACEKILDKEFLKKISSKLDTQTILVGIPHQGAFIAIKYGSSFEGKFIGFIKQKFENPEADPLTPHVFQIQNGEIVGVAGENLGTCQKGIEQKSNGDYIVELNSDSLESFKDEVSTGYSQAMMLAMKNPNFSGNIIFNQNNNEFKFDKKVKEKCISFVKQIEENEMAQTLCKAISGNNISPSFAINLKPIQLSEKDDQKKKWWKFGK